MNNFDCSFCGRSGSKLGRQVVTAAIKILNLIACVFMAVTLLSASIETGSADEDISQRSSGCGAEQRSPGSKTVKMLQPGSIFGMQFLGITDRQLRPYSGVGGGFQRPNTCKVAYQIVSFNEIVNGAKK